jgi:hypothetical protein
VDADAALNPSTIPTPPAPMKRRLTPPPVAAALVAVTAVAIFPPIADNAVDNAIPPLSP